MKKGDNQPLAAGFMSVALTSALVVGSLTTQAQDSDTVPAKPAVAQVELKKLSHLDRCKTLKVTGDAVTKRVLTGTSCEEILGLPYGPEANTPVEE